MATTNAIRGGGHNVHHARHTNRAARVIVIFTCAVWVVLLAIGLAVWVWAQTGSSR